jgi:aspartate racemase
MKIGGMIGGIGPGSTIEYYRGIVSLYQEKTADGSYPFLLLNSIDLKKLLDLAAAGAFPDLTEYLIHEVRKLARAGADFGFLASNTPHIVFDEVSRQSPIPLISLVECTCAEAKERGLSRLGLIGTRFTMQADFYPAVLGKDGIVVVTPRPEEQEYIHKVYLDELVRGIFLPATLQRLLAIIGEMVERDAVEGIILGGTELPLILREEQACGVPLLDTTKIHVRAIVERMLSE